MLEALAKASAELEKSVTAFTEQLISFNESLQKSLDEELRAVNGRMEGCIKTNLSELGHNKHQLIKRLLDAEHEELTALSVVSRDVRKSLSEHALEVEQKIEVFMNQQILELKEFLQQPESQINTAGETAASELKHKCNEITRDIQERDRDTRRRLSDKVAEVEKLIKEQCEKVKQSISIAADRTRSRLDAQRKQIRGDVDKFNREATAEVESSADEGLRLISTCESQHKESVTEVSTRWKQHINDHCDLFHKTVATFSGVLNENYETQLANVSAQAKREITKLSDDAHEKITATRNELEVEMRDLEKDYAAQFEQAIRKLEVIVNAQANDKKNSGGAREHKAAKLRDQMQGHLKRWGGDLIDSVKDASHDFENDYNRATDGFHTRIELARSTAVELIERESKLMQKDIDRTLKDFQKDIDELEGELGRIEKAGQDAALTVIAFRKAVLSFRGE